MKGFYLFCFSVFLFTGQAVLAQEKVSYPQHVIEFYPNLVFDSKSPSIQFGYEYRFHPRRTIHGEIGYVNRFIPDFNKIIKSEKGIFTLSEYRFYTKKKNFSNPNASNAYVGFYGSYLYKNIEKSGTFEIDNGAYLQRIHYTVKEKNWSLGLSVGFKASITDRFYMGMGLVMGKIFYTATFAGIPDNATLFVPQPLFPIFSNNLDADNHINLQYRLFVGYVLDFKK